MAKFYLVCADAKRIPHTGLRVVAQYRQQPENPLEKPQRLTVFNRWPPVEMEADVVTIDLDGVYEYPDGTRIKEYPVFAPKTRDGLYLRGYNPEEIACRIKNKSRLISSEGV